jgi:hypothetical protein
MRRDEVEAFIGCGGDEGIEAVGVGGVAINESLGGDEASCEGDIQFSGVSFAGEDDACFLLFAVAELARGAHEHRCDPVDEFTLFFGVHGEVHPAEFLNW